MNIVVCKTFELTQRDWKELISGFNEAFNKEITIENLTNHYVSNEFGYSIHAITRDKEGKFCGHTSVMPQYYKVNGELIKVGLSGGTFILKHARSDIFLFKKMYEKLKEKCGKEGLTCIVGVPNQNSYLYTLKVLKKTHLKDLNYYVFPVNPIPGNRLLCSVTGKLSRLYTYSQKWLSGITNLKEEDWPIEIMKSQAFLEARLGKEYKHYKTGGMSCFYRMYNEDGKNVAYIMQFDENGRRPYRALVSLIDEILRREKPDIIMYIGTLKLKQFLLFKLPKRFEPKQLPLTITLLGNKPEKLKNTLLTGENWDFGLINFDVR